MDNRSTGPGPLVRIFSDSRGVKTATIACVTGSAIFLVLFASCFVFFAKQANSLVAIHDPEGADALHSLIRNMVPLIWALALMIFVAVLVASCCAFKAGVVKGQKLNLQQGGCK